MHFHNLCSHSLESPSRQLSAPFPNPVYFPWSGLDLGLGLDNWLIHLMIWQQLNVLSAGTKKWFKYWEPRHWPGCAGLPGEAPHEHERHPGHHAQHPEQRQHPHPGAGQAGGEQPQHRVTLPDKLGPGQSQEAAEQISWGEETEPNNIDIWHTYTYHSLRVFAELVINHLMCRAYPALASPALLSVSCGEHGAGD